MCTCVFVCGFQVYEMNFLLKKAGLKKKKQSERGGEDAEDGSNNYCAPPGENKLIDERMNESSLYPSINLPLRPYPLFISIHIISHHITSHHITST